MAFFIFGVDGKTITRKLFEDIYFNLTPVIAVVSTIIVGISILLMGASLCFTTNFPANFYGPSPRSRRA
ncbi:hypothetical protein [Sinorhizobium psoraleae]|uniref:Uncharacterized protein n=1 Tax=Sinorhizobium psoraleae TaxID=520838 RepID=A0ABT4KPG5_9HYPH|nr:hypothetical protein [Sinorhizobium psoraleae]MCZ4093729.1 hypothetical protein [Sinorhizobium psoraleae]